MSLLNVQDLTLTLYGAPILKQLNSDFGLEVLNSFVLSSSTDNFVPSL